MDGHLDGWIDGWMYGWMDGHSYKWTFVGYSMLTQYTSIQTNACSMYDTQQVPLRFVGYI